jgi:uncharacterized membrane protein YdjX (TVP38/TMEM64 family)
MSTTRLTVQDHKSLRRRLLLFIMALTLLIGTAIAWSWTPLQHFLNTELIVAKLQHLGNTLGPAAAVCGFAMAVSAAVPLTFLILVTILTFGPWAGFTYSLIGALIGATVSYGMGRFLGHQVVSRLGGMRVNEISRRLAGRGLLAIIALRMVPIAPFAVINMIVGASHIRLRDLLLGTAIGIMPSTLVMMFFVEQIIAALKQPGSLSLFLLAFTLVLIGAGLWGLRRWLGCRDQG